MPEAPLATEENLEDSEPLPYWYTVEAGTVACLMIRNRSNGSHLIYRKRLQDYIAIVCTHQGGHANFSSGFWKQIMQGQRWYSDLHLLEEWLRKFLG
jgi:hypothetical protein